MEIDNYLPCDAYAGHSDAPTDDFRIFKNEDDAKFYFTMVSPKGVILLRSEGYPAMAARDNGMASVVKNRVLKERYKIIEDDNKFLVILKAGNHQEIARSCPFSSQKELLKTFAFIQDDSTALFPWLVESTADNEIDDYLPCEAYLGHTNSVAEGFKVFKHEETNEHYFVMLNKANEVLFRSEGYPAIAPRDKGLASVQKNREIKERYKIITENDHYFLILRAGNHQEIARSCPFNSHEALLAMFAFMGENSTAAFPWHESVANLEIDNYLPCEAYHGHAEKPADGFRTFKTEEKGEYYFTMLNTDDEVLLRSEGYPSVGARDNGLKSVQKNREIKERYSIVEEDGNKYVILKAGNHQEIARSCPFEDSLALFGLFPFLSEGYTGGFPWGTALAGAGIIRGAMAAFGHDATAEIIPIPEPTLAFDIENEGADNIVLEEPADSISASSMGTAALGIAGAAALGLSEITDVPSIALGNEILPDSQVEASIPIPDEAVASPVIVPNDDHSGIPFAGAAIAAAGAVGMAAFAGTEPALKAAIDTPIIPPVAVATPLADVAATGGGLPKWLLPLLGIILLGLLLWWLLKSCNTDKTGVTTANTEMTVLPVDSSLNANIGTDSSAAEKPSAAATGALVGAQVEDFSSVVLFFENDQPNKNSTAITTTASYTETFEKYMSAKNTFVNQQDSEEEKKAIAAFFTDDVKKGYQDLKELTGKIAEALENGKKVEVKVKGFASPLAANDYNINLTKRRITSILNYFKKFESGRVAKYIGNVAITEEPNGEGSAPAGISDDKINVKNSVYNLSASKERRVEILDVRIK